MEDRLLVHLIITVISSVAASSGFWAYLQAKDTKKDAVTNMLIGLGHDRIITLGLQYIERGFVTRSEYENLYTYLYLPYKDLEGNGSATKVMNEVNKLPIRYEHKMEELR